MEAVNSVAAIIGFVNGLRLLEKGDYRGFAFFCASVIAGVVAGLLGWLGLSGAEAGFLAGLAGSGYYRAGQVVSGK